MYEKMSVSVKLLSSSVVEYKQNTGSYDKQNNFSYLGWC